jgi:hypothetical protein
LSFNCGCRLLRLHFSLVADFDAFRHGSLKMWSRDLWRSLFELWLD